MRLRFLVVFGLFFGLLVFAQTTIFSDNMTNFPTGWTLSGTGWTKKSDKYYSSSYSAKCTPNSSYSNNMNVSMSRSVNLSGYTSATLKFYIWQYTEANYDYIYVEYYNGSSWTTAWSRSGSYQSWQQISVNIPVTATQIRFRFYSDGSVTYTGVYIDDVVLTATSGTTTKKWTIMVYLNADNDLEAYGIQDLNEMEAVGSTNDFNIVVQMDRASGYDATNGDWKTCRRYYVTKDANTSTISSTMISDLGEVDMGSYSTLVSFVDWAKTNYPAEKYFLVLWDHGDGWYKGDEAIKSFSNDNSSGNAIDVSNGEFANALSQIKTKLGKNIDLIGFDACLMGMWEVMYIAKDYAGVMVCSEETEGAAGWYYTNFLNSLKSNPSMSAVDLGKAVVNGTSGQSTLSVIDLTTVSTLSTKINTFAQELMNARGAGYSSTISSCRSSTKQFYITSHIDLYDFANKIYSASVPTALKNAASDLMNYITGYVVKLYKNSSSYSVCRGVAIYHPTSTSIDSRYNSLPSSSATQWDEYIKGGTSGGGGGGTVTYTLSSTTYSWVSTSTATGITGDDQSKQFALPFTFNFYGTNYTSVYVCSNGFLSFTSNSTAYSPASIPNTAAPNALIAPFWRDLNPSGGGTITYYSGSDKFVVTWNAVKNYSNSNTQTFQVILYPNGQIVFQYNNVTNDVTTVRGIENINGTAGVPYSTNPSNGTAVRFTPSTSKILTYEDGKIEVLRVNGIFKDVMEMEYSVPYDNKVRVDVYNIAGQKINTLKDEFHFTGRHTIRWDGKDITGNKVGSGTYFMVITPESGEKVTQKVVLIK